MPRCPDCGKFTSQDTEVEPEELSAPEINEKVFTVEYTRPINCAECGTELKNTQLALEQQVTYPEKCEPTDDPKEDGEHEWEFDLTAEPTDSGGGRYQKRMLGVHVTGTAVCSKCQSEVTIDCEAATSAGSFDDSV